MFLDSLCKFTKNRSWSSGGYFVSGVSNVPHASDCCRLCQEDAVCVHASYLLGASLADNCIFHWPNGDQPLTLRSTSSSDKIALEATDCACGTGYCCMLISSVNRYLTIGSLY